MMQSDQGNLPDRPKPKPDKAFQKTVWLQIYLPLIFIILLLAALVSILWIGDVGSYSGWADSALVILMIPALLVGILVLGVIAGLCYGVMYVIGWLPGPARRGQEILERVSVETRRFADLAARPFMAPRAVVSTIRETIRYLASIFSKEG
jgi:hypothetical protein